MGLFTWMLLALLKMLSYGDNNDFVWQSSIIPLLKQSHVLFSDASMYAAMILQINPCALMCLSYYNCTFTIIHSGLRMNENLKVFA